MSRGRTVAGLATGIGPLGDLPTAVHLLGGLPPAVVVAGPDRTSVWWGGSPAEPEVHVLARPWGLDVISLWPGLGEDDDEIVAHLVSQPGEPARWVRTPVPARGAGRTRG